MFTLAQLAQWVEHSECVGPLTTSISSVSTDSRQIQAGQLFFALVGEQFDGHAYAQQVAEKGAAALILSQKIPGLTAPYILVKDTKIALGQLAKAWRAQFKLPLIGITGSNGKTTVTQMVASILNASAGVASWATKGNLNNDIGVPLTLLGLNAQHECAVIEMGMNHPGEIAYLANITQATVALVNNAQREHLEFMHTVENVARENGSCISFLKETDCAVFPADDDFTALWHNLAHHCNVLTFAIDAPADIYALEHIWQNNQWMVTANTPKGICSFELHLAGLHNVKNALAALSCAIASGITPSIAAQGLTAFAPVKGRSRAFEINFANKKITLVDDSYNANPDSMKAAVDVLSTLAKPCLLVIGDMGEVGNQGPQFHEELGHYAQLKQIDLMYCTGEASIATANAFNKNSSQGKHFSNKEQLHDAVNAALKDVNSILVKGSRFMKMESVIEAIYQHILIEDSHHAV